MSKLYLPPTESDIKEISKIADYYSNELGYVSYGELRDGIEGNSLIISKDLNTNTIVGYVLWRTRKRDSITRVYSFGVLPSYSRQGIGRELLKFVPRPIILSCPESSVSGREFYLSQGFKNFNIKQGRKQKLYEFKLD